MTCGFSWRHGGDTGDTVEVRRRGRPRASPGQQAAARVGPWPGQWLTGSARNGLAHRHAAGVWTDARDGMVNRSAGLWERVGEDPARFGGQVDLAFLGTVAGHLARCERCWQTWIDGEVPVQLLTRAVRRTPAGQVWRVLEREIRAQRRREGLG